MGADFHFNPPAEAEEQVPTFVAPILNDMNRVIGQMQGMARRRFDASVTEIAFTPAMWETWVKGMGATLVTLGQLREADFEEYVAGYLTPGSSMAFRGVRLVRSDA